jgi:hypothetical protein
MSFIKLKRDITTENHPSESQVEIGELVMNCTTGILYTKLIDGSLVKFSSSPVSSGDAPVVSFTISDNFCCDNDSITANISNLVVGGEYTYEFGELGNNGLVLYPEDQKTGQLTPSDSDTRSVTILAQKTGEKTVALVKFTVKKSGVAVAEGVATISCGTCVDQTNQ